MEEYSIEEMRERDAIITRIEKLLAELMDDKEPEKIHLKVVK
jgi:hypothetical protein